MCEHYKYMLQIKPEFDVKFQKTGIRSQMIYLCEVEDVKKGNFILNYDKKRFSLIVKECGKCHICRFKKASIKACQAQSEFKTVGKGSFITLTFGQQSMSDYIKKDKRYSKLSTYMKQKYIDYLQWTLEKREFQLFIKRLRDKLYRQDLSTYSLQKGYTKNLFTLSGRPRKKVIMCKDYDYSDFKPRKIRYMHCGEYGENKGRPHHHAIIFGVDFSWDSSKVRYSWKKQRNVVIHFNNLLNDLWQFGDITTDNVNYQTCNYVARYISKKVTNKNKDYVDKDISGSVYRGRLPEFCTQSNRRGLGYDYYMQNAHKINKDLQLSFLNQKGEIKFCPLPRYFKELMKRYFKSDYLRMQKLSIEKQQEFSEIPPELLYNRMLTDRRKVDNMLLQFKGNFERSYLSNEQSRYLEFELKKRIFDDLVTYKQKLLASYSDTDFVDTFEPCRITCYKNFEKYRRFLYRQSLNNYVSSKVDFPDKSDLMLQLHRERTVISCLDNPFTKENIEIYGFENPNIMEVWRNYE